VQALRSPSNQAWLVTHWRPDKVVNDVLIVVHAVKMCRCPSSNNIIIKVERRSVKGLYNDVYLIQRAMKSIRNGYSESRGVSMERDMGRALVLEERNGETDVTFHDLPRDAFTDGDVLVAVEYSSLNYKDGLAVMGRDRVVRRFPMVPGIDFAGTVIHSNSDVWKPGDKVILTGWGHGEQFWGGFSQLACTRHEWLVRVPDGLDTEFAMILGTAGLTAMLAVMALEQHGLTPDNSEVVVTGAAGGVGSLSVAILAALGYSVVASTGRPSTEQYLRLLGASRLIGREILASPSQRPLESAQWAAAIDTVGGTTLSGLLRTVNERAGIAVCGNAGGMEFHTTVLPFILRGANMFGIESAREPIANRREAWQRLASTLSADLLQRTYQLAELEDVPELSERILRGDIQGRVVIDTG